MSSYYNAQICTNGHTISVFAENNSSLNENFCSKCGSNVIRICQECSTPIRGRDREDYWTKYRVPSYCYKCGKPFPWTSATIESTKEILLFSDVIKREDLLTLDETYRDLIVSTPKTQVAAMKFKILLTKAGKTASDAIYQIMVDVLSEAVRKTVWPDN